MLFSVQTNTSPFPQTSSILSEKYPQNQLEKQSHFPLHKHGHTRGFGKIKSFRFHCVHSLPHIIYGEKAFFFFSLCAVIFNKPWTAGKEWHLLTNHKALDVSITHAFFRTGSMLSITFLRNYSRCFRKLLALTTWTRPTSSTHAINWNKTTTTKLLFSSIC